MNGKYPVLISKECQGRAGELSEISHIWVRMVFRGKAKEREAEGMRLLWVRTGSGGRRPRWGSTGGCVCISVLHAVSVSADWSLGPLQDHLCMLLTWFSCPVALLPSSFLVPMVFRNDINISMLVHYKRIEYTVFFKKKNQRMEAILYMTEKLNSWMMFEYSLYIYHCL